MNTSSRAILEYLRELSPTLMSDVGLTQESAHGLHCITQSNSDCSGTKPKPTTTQFNVKVVKQ